MKRRAFITLLGGAVAGWPLAARAQQPGGRRRLAVLMATAADDPESRKRLFALLQSMQQLGWVEGRNLRIDIRWAAGNTDDTRNRARARRAAGMEAVPLNVREVAEIERAVAAVARPGNGGLIVTASGAADAIDVDGRETVVLDHVITVRDQATIGGSSRTDHRARSSPQTPCGLLAALLRRLPPGRARLATRPSWTGSSATAKTMGIVVVAALAAKAEGVPPVTAMTATCRRTNWAASAGSRLYWPSAQRYSIATFSPSTKPASFSPWRNARRLRSTTVSGDVGLRNPITGIAPCCALAASGHEITAAPPSSVMNSRRFIRSPRS